MTTGGEGGMVTTNSYKLWKKCGNIKIMENLMIQFTRKNIQKDFGGYNHLEQTGE